MLTTGSIRGWSTHITIHTTGWTVVVILVLGGHIGISNVGFVTWYIDVLRGMVGSRGVVGWVVRRIWVVDVGIS